MATCYSDDAASIIVNPVDPGSTPYFKYCNTGRYYSHTAVAGISLLSAGYIYNINDEHPVLLLTADAKNSLNKRLRMQSGKYLEYTVFQTVIIDYNIEKFGIYVEDTEKITEYNCGKPLPLNLIQPDYRRLPSEEEAKQKIKGKTDIVIFDEKFEG